MKKNYHLMPPGTTFPDLTDLIGVDLETTGLSNADPEAYVCGIGIGDVQGQYYFPLQHKGESDSYTDKNFVGEDRERLLHWLRSVFQKKERVVVFHNAAFDLGFLRKEFQEKSWDFFKCSFEDSMILATLLNENRSVSLEQLTRNVLGLRPLQKEKFHGFYRFSTLAPKEVSDYCCEDVWLTLSLFIALKFHKDLKDLKEAYQRELQFSTVLADLEMQGCPFSKEEFFRVQKCLVPKWENTLAEVFSKLPAAIEESEFLRAPSQITAEYLQVLTGAHPATQSAKDSELIRLWHLLDSYERIYHVMEIFPKTGTVVSPRYRVTKTDGRLYSPFHHLYKNPLTEEWGLKKIISAPPTALLFEITFEELIPRIGLALAQDELYFELQKNPALDLYQRIAQELKTCPQKAKEVLHQFFFNQEIWKTHPFEENLVPLFQKLFSKWIQCQERFSQEVLGYGFVTSLLGRRRHLPKDQCNRASQAFLNLSVSEFFKNLLSIPAWTPQVVLQMDDKIVFRLQNKEESSLLLKQLSPLFQLGKYQIPLKLNQSFGANWEELENNKQQE